MFEQCVHRPLNAFHLPLTSKAMAYFLGICLHLLQLCLRMGRMQPTSQCSCSWEDFSVDADGAWIDWVSCPFTPYIWWHHLAWLQTDFGCIILIVGAILHGVVILTRFEIYRLVGRKATLTIWSPNEFELHLLCVYSPAHALMWMVTSSANWILMVMIMALLSKQVSFVSWLKSTGSYHDALSCVYWAKRITQSSVTSKSWLQWSECLISLIFMF